MVQFVLLCKIQFALAYVAGRRRGKKGSNRHAQALRALFFPLSTPATQAKVALTQLLIQVFSSFDPSPSPEVKMHRCSFYLALRLHFTLVWFGSGFLRTLK